MSVSSSRDRLERHAKEWDVSLDHIVETDTSLIAYGRRKSTAVVLKVVKRPGDEWLSGALVEAFDGHGMVRVFEHTGGVLLLERLDPGTPLLDVAIHDDPSATEILASVIRDLSSPQIPVGYVTVREWGEAFDRYDVTRDSRIPKPLVERARETFEALCVTQRNTRLLHGDLQHSNILFDQRRGWVAIDPKGVVGEVEYEIGAALRNPREAPELFTDRATIERRLDQFASMLHLDRARTLAWAFSQAVLSMIWSIEDGESVSAANPTMALAHTLASSLDPHGAFSPRA